MVKLSKEDMLSTKRWTPLPPFPLGLKLYKEVQFPSQGRGGWAQHPKEANAVTTDRGPGCRRWAVQLLGKDGGRKTASWATSAVDLWCSGDGSSTGMESLSELSVIQTAHCSTHAIGSPTTLGFSPNLGIHRRTVFQPLEKTLISVVGWKNDSLQITYTCEAGTNSTPQTF